jgi:hypothetical protein
MTKPTRLAMKTRPSPLGRTRTGLLAGILISARAAPALASPSSFTDHAQEQVPEGFVVRDVGGKARSSSCAHGRAAGCWRPHSSGTEMTNISKKIHRRAALAASILLLSAAPSAAADAWTSFDTAGSCTEAIVFVPVDADVARRHVPPGFTLTEVAGTARLQVFSESCSTSVNSEDPSSAVVGGVGFPTEAAASPAGCRGYALYWTGSRRDDFLRAYRRIGWRTPLDRDGRFSVTGVGPGAIVTAHNRNRVGSWDLTLVGTTGPQLPAQIPFESVHCHVGPRGLVKGVFPHEFNVAAPMNGTLEVERGSLLWTLVGERDVVTAPGLFFQFEFTGTTALVDA